MDRCDGIENPEKNWHAKQAKTESRYGLQCGSDEGNRT
jgi:hypothetical protein